MALKAEDRQELDRLFLKSLMHRGNAEVTDEEVEYFREHPEQIDKISAPVNIHKWFLIVGTLLGATFVAASKMLKFSELFVVRSEATREFLVDIVFETGVALIGAAATEIHVSRIANSNIIFRENLADQIESAFTVEIFRCQRLRQIVESIPVILIDRLARHLLQQYATSDVLIRDQSNMAGNLH